MARVSPDVVVEIFLRDGSLGGRYVYGEHGSVVARAFGDGGISASNQAYIDIPAGQSSVVLRINPIDDPIVEGTEDASFTLLANPAYRLGKNRTAGVSIGDDDLLIFRPFNVALTRRHILDSIFSDSEMKSA